MSQDVIYLLIAVFIVICVVSIVYIRRHYGIIQQVKSDQLVQQQKAQQRYDEKRAYIIESIQVISKAVGNDEKLTYTEACIRLSALLESLAPHLLNHPDFSVIYEVYKRTEHIPIKEDWKKLSKQKQWTYKKEMAKVESEFSKEVDEAARKLANFDFDSMLH